jgi:hypothetical protein
MTTKSSIPTTVKVIFAVALSFLCLSSVSYAAVAEIPTAGLATTSIVVGGAGVVGGIAYSSQPWWYRGLLGVGGAGLVVVDPPAATYLNGRSVINYPKDLLRFSQVVWFGEFSADPTQPGAPVAPSGLYQESFNFPLQG